MQRSIILWMYEDLGGPRVRAVFKSMLEERGWRVLDQPDLARGWIENGVPFDGQGRNLLEYRLLFHMWEDGLTPKTIDLLRCCEQGGVKVVNPTASLDLCRDKLWANIRLRQQGLPVPASFVTDDIRVALDYFQKHGPIILKPRVGHCGAGILRVLRESELIDYFGVCLRAYGIVYAEQYIAFGEGDHRAEIINGEYIGGYRRLLDKHPYKTNMGSGGRNLDAALPQDMIELAGAAAEAMHLPYTIVDMVRETATGKPYIIEVNHLAGVFRDIGAQHFSETMPFEKPFIDPVFSFDELKFRKIVESFETFCRE